MAGWSVRLNWSVSKAYLEPNRGFLGLSLRLRDSAKKSFSGFICNHLQPHLQPYKVLSVSCLLSFFREGCRWQMKNKTISFLLDLLCFNSLQYLLRMNLCLYFLRSKYSLYDTFFVHEVCSAQDADSFSAANNLFAPTSKSLQ